MKIGQRIIFDKKTGTILNGCLDEREDTGLTEEERLRREKEELENQLLLLQDEKTRGLL